jgi:2-oxoglutarate dehydrogenase E2 component (dihydrolipoamide succinyltransferase)
VARTEAQPPKAVPAATAPPPAATASAPVQPAPVQAIPPKAAAVGRRDEVVRMSPLRRAVARRLVEARQAMAMLTTFNEIDMSAVMALRKESQENFTRKHGVKLGFMSFFVKATVEALKALPQLNASVKDEDIVYHNSFDIGIAIGSEKGLVVPTLLNAGSMSFAQVEKAVADFAARARENKLKPDELQSGTFTITNGGVYGSLLSTPIVNPPQSGILGMHTIQERPIAINGAVVIRPMMYVALSYDHRIVDGKEAVTFLVRVKEMIENPARILLEI